MLLSRFMWGPAGCFLEGEGVWLVLTLGSWKPVKLYIKNLLPMPISCYRFDIVSAFIILK